MFVWLTEDPAHIITEKGYWELTIRLCSRWSHWLPISADFTAPYYARPYVRALLKCNGHCTSQKINGSVPVISVRLVFSKNDALPVNTYLPNRFKLFMYIVLGSEPISVNHFNSHNLKQWFKNTKNRILTCNLTFKFNWSLIISKISANSPL